MKLCGILFYHPKNPQNLADVALLAAHKRVPLFVLPRPGGPKDVPHPRAKIIVLEKLADLTRFIEDAYFVVLETYGRAYINEVEVSHESKCIVLVVGAEDYGVPMESLGSLPGPYIVAKIPVSVEGMSYNVVVSAAIALYELEKILPRGGTRGTYEAQ